MHAPIELTSISTALANKKTFVRLPSKKIMKMTKRLHKRRVINKAIFYVVTPRPCLAGFDLIDSNRAPCCRARLGQPACLVLTTNKHHIWVNQKTCAVTLILGASGGLFEDGDCNKCYVL